MPFSVCVLQGWLDGTWPCDVRLKMSKIICTRLSVLRFTLAAVVLRLYRPCYLLRLNQCQLMSLHVKFDMCLTEVDSTDSLTSLWLRNYWAHLSVTFIPPLHFFRQKLIQCNILIQYVVTYHCMWFDLDTRCCCISVSKSKSLECLTFFYFSRSFFIHSFYVRIHSVFYFHHQTTP